MSKFARGGQYEPLWDTVMLLSEDSVSDAGMRDVMRIEMKFEL